MNIPSAMNLPQELAYLAVALDELAKIPDENLDEDVETTTLDSALRERVKGLSLSNAITRLNEDINLLKKWLGAEKIGDSWAVWISAYLMRPGALARNLLYPSSSVSCPSSDIVEMEMPTGWTRESISEHLIIKKGKIACKISPSNEMGYKGKINQNEIRERAQNDSRNPLAHPGKWSKSEVRFGEWSGYKYSYDQTTPATWKAIEYVLMVEGGFVLVSLSHEKGKHFDETDVEAKFHTLKIVPPNS